MSHRRRGRRSIGHNASSAPIVRAPVPSMVEGLEPRRLLSSFVVTDLADSGTGSLRDDILMSNAAGGANTITFAPGLSGTITLTSGQLEISDDLTITGPGAASLAISGNNQSRVFQIDASSTVSISSLTIKGGHAPDGSAGVNGSFNPVTHQFANGTAGGTGGDGGGVYNLASLSLSGDVISDNSAGVGGNGGAGGVAPTAVVGPAGAAGGGGSGGGIYSAGPLDITDSEVVNNRAGDASTPGYNNGSPAAGGSGGGIWSSGNLRITDSTIDGNTAGYGSPIAYGPLAGDGGNGGGIESVGPAIITGSTIRNNAAGSESTANTFAQGGSGGGLFSSLTTTLTNCTITRNMAGIGSGVPNVTHGGPGNGGGIANAGAIRLTNVTLANNNANQGTGGGIYSRGKALLNNSVIAGNVGAHVGSTADDIDGAVDATSGFNLIGVNTGMTGLMASNGNLIGTSAHPVDPNLGPLGNYGGPTQTMPPVPGSPAIDAGSDALAVGPDGSPLTTDQRGLPRIVDATHTGTPTVDIGAVEVDAFRTSPVTTTADPPLFDYSPDQLSFRQALFFAGVLGGPQTITFVPSLTGTISGVFELTKTTGKVTIQGPGPGLSVGDLEIDSGASAEVDGLGIVSLRNNGLLDLTNLSASSDITNAIAATMSMRQCTLDAVVGNSGTLSIDQCALTSRLENDGIATISNSSFGGNASSGISNSGKVTLSSSTLSAALGDGLDNSGTATLTDCTVSGSHGVGIMDAAGGSLSVSGGAISGNTGGGVSGPATIANCQITNNAGVGVSGPALALTNCTISGNKGDGIDATGNLRADGCTIQDNASRGVNDAAGSSAVLNNCTIVGNQGPTSGGGIYNPAGATLTLINSTISNNTATAGGGLVPQASGGGIENSGTALLANCTIAGNVASAGATTGAEISGGGIDNSGTLRLTNCTVANNSANAGTSPTNDANGGGIYIGTGHVTLNNTIVAGNYTVLAVGSSPPDDLVGAVGPSSAYNLIGYASAATGLIAANHNQLGSADAPIDPKLAALANNGGPTQTMALLAGSPAIDAGSNALAVGPDGKPLVGDQRGFGRIFNGTVDIGAYEFGASLLGDADRDGKVDFADLVLVARHFGMTSATWSDGDFNNDGSVGFDDLLIVARNYGASAAAPQAAIDAPSLGRPASLSPAAPDAPSPAALARHRRPRAIRLTMSVSRAIARPTDATPCHAQA